MEQNTAMCGVCGSGESCQENHVIEINDSIVFAMLIGSDFFQGNQEKKYKKGLCAAFSSINFF